MTNMALTGKFDILERLDYFLNWSHMKKAISWLLQLLQPKNEQAVVRTRSKVKMTSNRKVKPTTVDEMERAEVIILKLVQNDAFSGEIAAL